MGIKAATGEFIFFFDDDIIIPAGSIEKALETFQNNPDVQVVGGPNVTPPENGFIQYCFGFAHASPFVGLQTAARYRPVKNITKVSEKHLVTCNLAFRAKTLKENLFNPQICPNEENELLGRLTHKGFLLAYNPEFFIYHHRRKTVKAYSKQIFNWGRGRTIHTVKQPSHFDPAFFVPLVFVLYLLSLIFLHAGWYFLPLAFYGILDLIFAAQTAWEYQNQPAFFTMLALFPLTHITYALGLVAGFFDAWKEKTIPDEKEFLLIKVELT
jgi:GT2 family glycosyltransferase